MAGGGLEARMSGLVQPITLRLHSMSEQELREVLRITEREVRTMRAAHLLLASVFYPSLVIVTLVVFVWLGIVVPMDVLGSEPLWLRVGLACVWWCFLFWLVHRLPVAGLLDRLGRRVNRYSREVGTRRRTIEAVRDQLSARRAHPPSRE
jgi:hypothetical protein